MFQQYNELELLVLSNLIHLINMTRKYKKISKQRFFIELIRNWRFITFIKKMARKKYELTYKNLYLLYLQIANEIFGN